jgi:hypothetical protein
MSTEKSVYRQYHAIQRGEAQAGHRWLVSLGDCSGWDITCAPFRLHHPQVAEALVQNWYPLLSVAQEPGIPGAARPM